MNQEMYSPGFGFASPRDPRLLPRSAPHHQVVVVAPKISSTTPSKNQDNTVRGSANQDNDVQIINQMPPIARTPQDPRKGPLIKMKSRPKKNLSFTNISTVQATTESADQVKKNNNHPSVVTPTRTSTPPRSSTPPLTPPSSSSPPPPAAAAAAASPSPSPSPPAPPQPQPPSKQQTSLSASQQQQPLPKQPQQAQINHQSPASTKVTTPPLARQASLLTTPPIITQPSVSSNGSNGPTLSDSLTKKIDNRVQLTTMPVHTFTWGRYLELVPAEVAPKEAFMQSQEQLVNLFMPGMKLEAKDPRNSSSWCLASIVTIQGLRLRLRFDGGDSMNDFYELIDSENIRPYGSSPGSILLPPMAYKGNLSTYSKFVEKQLFKPDVVIAPSNYFAPTPKRPEHNLFKTGMKLEAIDRKNPFLICPASVGEVNGDDIKIIFDGWRGSFDYSCKYYSREIFPVNWCRDTNHGIAPPNGWEGLLDKKSSPPPKIIKSPTKEKLLLKVDLVPKPKASPKITLKRSESTSKPEVSPQNKIHSSSASKTLDAALIRKLETAPLKKPEVSAPSKKVETSPPKKAETSPPKKAESSSPKRVEISPPKKVEVTPPKKVDVSPPKRAEVSPTRKGETSPNKKGEPSSSSKKTSISPNKPVETSSQSEVEISTTPKEVSPAKVEVSSVRRSEKRKMSISPQPNDDDQQDLEDFSKIDRFQCQRTVSYSDWLKAKEMPPSDSQPKRIKLDPSSYSVSEVAELIKSDVSLAKYSEIFENHEIDGKAFLLLTSDMMINHMGLKIGPVLKINNLIEQVKRSKS